VCYIYMRGKISETIASLIWSDSDHHEVINYERLATLQRREEVGLRAKTRERSKKEMD